MYPQNEMAALVLAHAFEDELVHIKEAGVLSNAKKGVRAVASRVRRVYEEGSPVGVRRALGLRTPAAAEQTGRIKELNRLALAQREARRPVYGKGLARPKAQGVGAVGGSGLGGFSDPGGIEAVIQRGRQLAALRGKELAARGRLTPLEMPQPTALKATPARRPSQGVMGPAREANRAALERMRARRNASMGQAGGFGRLMKTPDR